MNAQMLAALTTAPGTVLVPAAYCGHPFGLAKADDGQQVLRVGEDSGLLPRDPLPEQGEPFFDGYEQPSEPVRKVLEFLQQVAANGE